MEHPSKPLAYLPAETPVLMSDWLLKPLGDIRRGDEIVGWVKGTNDDRGHLVRAEVQAIHEARTQTVDVRLASGNPVRCVQNTRWFTNRYPTAADPSRKQYAEARPGSYLMQFDLVEDEPDFEAKLAWHYLAGMIDGEGHVADSSLPITQATDRNLPVWDRLCQVLDKLNISYLTRSDPTVAKAHWSPRSTAIVRNVRDEYRRLLRYANPAKAEQIRAALWRRPARPVRNRDQIVGVTPAGEQQCVALETATGNFVAWGYGASSVAQTDLCDRGHRMDVRTDSANKTYRSCPVCPDQPKMADGRRVVQHTDADRIRLAWAAECLRTGEAQAARKAAKVTQVQMSGKCRVSYGMVSGWETGAFELKGASGVRYANALAELLDPPA